MTGKGRTQKWGEERIKKKKTTLTSLHTVSVYTHGPPQIKLTQRSIFLQKRCSLRIGFALRLRAGRGRRSDNKNKKNHKCINLWKAEKLQRARHCEETSLQHNGEIKRSRVTRQRRRRFTHRAAASLST